MAYNDTPLIPRTVLFGNPDRASVQLSPDGAHLAWLAPLDGVLNVWVAPRDDLAGGPPGHARHRPRHPLLRVGLHQRPHPLHPGQERRRELAAVRRGPGQRRRRPGPDPLRGRAGPPARASAPSFPHEVLVGLNHRNPQWHDLYRLDILTGELTLLCRTTASWAS